MDFGPPSFAVQVKYQVAVVVCALAVIGSGCSSSESKAQAGANFLHPADPVEQRMIAGVGSHASIEDVSQVLATLNQVQATVRRDVLAKQAFLPEDEARLNAIFAEPARTFQTNLYRYDLIADGFLFKPNPGGARYVDISVVERHEDCVRVQASIDENANLVEQSQTLTPHDIVLVRQPHDTGINKTAWMIAQYVPTHFAVVDHCYDRSDEITL